MIVNGISTSYTLVGVDVVVSCVDSARHTTGAAAAGEAVQRRHLHVRRRDAADGSALVRRAAVRERSRGLSHGGDCQQQQVWM